MFGFCLILDYFAEYLTSFLGNAVISMRRVNVSEMFCIGTVKNVTYRHSILNYDMDTMEDPRNLSKQTV